MHTLYDSETFSVRTMVKSRSVTIVQALAEFVQAISKNATPKQAAELLRDLRSAKGANRLYLFGAWKNYKSYNELKKAPAMKTAFEAFQAAENFLANKSKSGSKP